ncbi:DNA cytosine methyltransferase [Pedobacter sp. GR22-6]|uniref:DNA cytosine methyltransferase n=1 Tax=Pedobacter sp. GR22-6 TaxID=3127957 RepID=UPI00307F4289
MRRSIDTLVVSRNQFFKMALSFVDLFAGAGGFGLGFQEGGFTPILSVEKDLWATDTLKKNNRHKILHADITTYIDNEEILKLVDGKPDVIIGGPPCQGFSLAGPSKDSKDPRNSLFLYFVRWVDIFQPKVFVMENVTGILYRKNSNGENVIDIIKNAFAEKGYQIELWNLNAANFGVPQLRNRVFIVGNLLNQVIGPPKATHKIPGILKDDQTLPDAVTVGEAIADLPSIRAGQGAAVTEYTSPANNSYQKWARQNCVNVYNHEAMKHTKRLISRFESIQSGLNIEDLSEELKVRKRNGNGLLSEVKYQSNYRHLKEDQISHTIPASFYSNFIHPTIPRNITSREAARIQSFPDNYIFEGQRTMISSKLLKRLGKEDQDHLSQYNQIGNAVPPLLAKSIAEHIRDFLIKNLETTDDLQELLTLKSP